MDPRQQSLTSLITITLIVGLILTTGGLFAYDHIGGELPGQEERTFVDDPTTETPENAAIANYENDLTTAERDAFRQADGSSDGIDGITNTINADYVELDGEYYPTYTDTTYTGYANAIFHILGLIALTPTALLAFLAVATLPLLALITLHRLSVVLIDTTGAKPITIAITLITIALTTMLLLNPVTGTAIHLSTSPAEDPALDNANVVHLTELTDRENSNARSAITSSQSAPHEHLNYERVDDRSSSHTLDNANYLHTDGEHYHITQEPTTEHILTGFHLLVLWSIASFIPLYAYQTRQYIEDGEIDPNNIDWTNFE